MANLFGDAVEKDAVVSQCGLYRYALARTWGDAERVLPFVMLNPSTADARDDDPTVRRCVGFAKRDGYSGVEVYNLYAFRAAKPRDLWKAADPVGPDGDQWLKDLAALGGPVVCAWGANAPEVRVAYVLKKILAAVPLLCLGLTDKGRQPRHPLFVRAAAPLVPFINLFAPRGA